MIELRPATNGDRDFLWRLHRATMRPYVERTWGSDEADQARRFRKAFDPARRQVVVVDGEPVGVLEVEERADEIYLSNIQIHPERQGRGRGRRVLRSVLERADAPARPVALQVLHGNPARRLYERLGFRPEGETATHLRMRYHPGGSPGIESHHTD